MHVSPLVSPPPGLKLISGVLGVPFGNLTAGAGLARPFAGSISATSSYWNGGSDTAYDPGSGLVAGIIGKIWPYPVVVGEIKAWSSGSGWDRASQVSTIYMHYQASNDTTTGLDGTWTDLLTESFLDAWGSQDARQVGISSLTRYLAHRIYFTTSYSPSYQCNGLEIYAYSWI